MTLSLVSGWTARQPGIQVGTAEPPLYPAGSQIVNKFSKKDPFIGNSLLKPSLHFKPKNHYPH